jgi:cytochrome c553
MCVPDYDVGRGVPAGVRRWRIARDLRYNARRSEGWPERVAVRAHEGKEPGGRMVMRRLASVALLGLLALPPLPAQAADLPEWAYPVNPAPTPPDAAKPIQLPGSTKQYTQAQIDDGFNPPDWYPQDHAAMPDVVAHGRKETNARACILCHLTSGAGHPESAGITGLPASYFMRQLAEFTSGARNGSRATSMIPIAKGLTEADYKIAAAYFASLQPRVWYQVVETDTVPKSHLGNGAMRFPDEHGGSEPIGNRIIELPQNDLSAESRDPRTGFIAHVPPGSLKKGEMIVATGAGGKTIACAACHGIDLKGVSEVPPITGRSPMYIYRQLNDIKIGARNGLWTPLMKRVVAQLTDDDMIAISAYLASQEP